MIGTGTAIALGLGAGINALGAAKQAGAAKSAAKTQAASADRAMALQSDLAKQSLALQQALYSGPGGVQQMYNPYTSSAPATLSALHSYLGIPGAAQAQVSVPPGGYGPPTARNDFRPMTLGALAGLGALGPLGQKRPTS